MTQFDPTKPYTYRNGEVPIDVFKNCGDGKVRFISRTGQCGYLHHDGEGRFCFPDGSRRHDIYIRGELVMDKFDLVNLTEPDKTMSEQDIADAVSAVFGEVKEPDIPDPLPATGIREWDKYLSAEFLAAESRQHDVLCAVYAVIPPPSLRSPARMTISKTVADEWKESFGVGAIIIRLIGNIVE